MSADPLNDYRMTLNFEYTIYKSLIQFLDRDHIFSQLLSREKEVGFIFF